MKKERCEKCGATRRLSRHHILPKIFWNGYGGTVVLCMDKCHREIEAIIHKAETKISGSKSVRYKLNENEYREILRRFLLSSDYD
jgi:hypothetical protein